MKEEVGFIGKIFGQKVEEAKKKPIKIGNKNHPLLASELRKGKGTWAYLITRDPKEKYVGKDVAIAVQTNRPIVCSVMEYLERNEISTHLILITTHENPKNVKELNDYDEKEWKVVIQDFMDVITKIQTEVGNVEFHFFFAAPASLTMAFGVIFGNFWNAHIYNWVKGENTYNKVLKLPLRL